MTRVLEDLVGLESVVAAELPVGEALDFERVLRELNANDLALGTWIHEGLSVSEIARKLGTTYTAAGVRVHRLKKRLREMLG